MEISDVRKRVIHAIAESRRTAAQRRVRAEAARTAFETFLEQTATPLFQQVASVLRAESYPFDVHTPSGGLRLVSTRNAENFIELDLDEGEDPPVVVGRVSRVRGSRVMTAERTVEPGTPIDRLSEASLLDFLIEEIRPFVER